MKPAIFPFLFILLRKTNPNAFPQSLKFRRRTAEQSPSQRKPLRRAIGALAAPFATLALFGAGCTRGTWKDPRSRPVLRPASRRPPPTRGASPGKRPKRRRRRLRRRESGLRQRQLLILRKSGQGKCPSQSPHLPLNWEHTSLEKL